MTKVYINPPLVGPDRADGGIRRVVEAQTSGLPKYGVECVASPDQAEVIFNHGALHEQRPGVPMIAGCHGLYWADYDWPVWGNETNKRVIDVLKASNAITVPSNWVGNALRRGIFRDMETIYHGVNASEWEPSPDWRKYVLWNKARTDAVSDPSDMQKLAAKMVDVPFLSTFGERTTNVRTIGALPFDDPFYRELVVKAGVGLVTPRETFGIGTLEFLAAGVPVVAWDYGGQSEIIIQGETGFLVPYGDYGLMEEAIRIILDKRARFSEAAREDAWRRWGWDTRIASYARLIKAVAKGHQADMLGPLVTVIITNYNLGAYIPDALQSLREQTLPKDKFQVVIVDDASTDGSVAQIKQWLAQNSGLTATVKITPKNLGLSGARNYGWQHATYATPYVIFLDADDRLPHYALAELSHFLGQNPATHIAYGGIEIIEGGGTRPQNDWPPNEFSWYGQIGHLNQLHYAAMMRWEVLEKTGGYRTRDWRAEDAAFWTRATSYGFRATRATSRPTLQYRFRSDSKSGQERAAHSDVDGDWTYFFPFRLGAASGPEGEALMQRGVYPNLKLVPFGAQGRPPAPHVTWPVYHHQHPVVSVVIPVGPGHEENVVNALDSVLAQTFLAWEAIVVWDTDIVEHPREALRGHDYAKVVGTIDTWGQSPDNKVWGAGAARNLGASVARAPLLLFLDADDLLRPDAMELMLKEWLKAGGYVYSDSASIQDEKHWDSPSTTYQAFDYDQFAFLSMGYTPNNPGAHGVTVLTAKADFWAVGGFKTALKFWEDWELFLNYAANGIEGHRVAQPLYTYYMSTGRRRQGSYEYEPAIREFLRELYEPYIKGAKEMCACGGGAAYPAAKNAIENALKAAEPGREERLARQESERPRVAGDRPGTSREVGRVRMQYIGQATGPVPYRGKVSRETYRAGMNPLYQTVEAHPDDVDGLLLTGKFQVMDMSLIPTGLPSMEY